MSSAIFNALFREKASMFRLAFSSVSTELFYDPIEKRLRHAGEYGMYRESVVRDFIKFIVPRSFDISTGFLISSMNDVSTQCDIVVFDSAMTPLYQEGEKQRFFPLESVFAVGEVKSTLTKQGLKDALDKLARVKALSENTQTKTILRRAHPGVFNPTINPLDLIPSFLICQKLDFSLEQIENELDAFYSSDIQHRHKHNMILSIEDGLLCYFSMSPEDKTLPYPNFAGGNLRTRFVMPTSIDEHAHLKYFGSYMFMMTHLKTALYPDFTDYLETPQGTLRNQT